MNNTDARDPFGRSVFMYKGIIRRDGRQVKFNAEKITIDIAKARAAKGEFDHKRFVN